MELVLITDFIGNLIKVIDHLLGKNAFVCRHIYASAYTLSHTLKYYPCLYHNFIPSSTTPRPYWSPTIPQAHPNPSLHPFQYSWPLYSNGISSERPALTLSPSSGQPAPALLALSRALLSQYCLLYESFLLLTLICDLRIFLSSLVCHVYNLW